MDVYRHRYDQIEGLLVSQCYSSKSVWRFRLILRELSLWSNCGLMTVFGQCRRLALSHYKGLVNAIMPSIIWDFPSQAHLKALLCTFVWYPMGLSIVGAGLRVRKWHTIITKNCLSCNVSAICSLICLFMCWAVLTDECQRYFSDCQ